MKHRFPRLPVFIGRKVGPGHCNIDDRSASKLHASVDIRDGNIWLRDAASTNGTFCGKYRLEPDQWTALGPSDQPVEFRIGGALFRAEGVDGPESEPFASGTLSGMIEGYGLRDPRPSTQPRGSHPASAGRAPRSVERSPPKPAPAGTSVRSAENARGVIEQLAPAWQDAQGSMATLRRMVENALDATPSEERAALQQAMAGAFPALMDDAGLRDVFERAGLVVVTGADRSGGLASSALHALDELSTWYTGREEAFTDEQEVVAFAARLRTTLDDFLLGYVPLLAGLNRFESQMAIHGPASAVTEPDSAAELAASLLDWRRDDVAPRSRLRASFAELMMHQVALLRGVMRGVKTLLTELSPAVIEQASEREGPPRGGLGRMFAKADPWAVYKRRHSDLSDEENERFRLLFGSDFVSEYRQFTREARADDGEDAG